MKYKKFPKSARLEIRMNESDMEELKEVSDLIQMDIPDLVRMYIRKNNKYYLDNLKNTSATIDKINKSMKEE